MFRDFSIQYRWGSLDCVKSVPLLARDFHFATPLTFCKSSFPTAQQAPRDPSPQMTSRCGPTRNSVPTFDVGAWITAVFASNLRFPSGRPAQFFREIGGLGAIMKIAVLSCWRRSCLLLPPGLGQRTVRVPSCEGYLLFHDSSHRCWIE